jgi:hypothetical protein
MVGSSIYDGVSIARQYVSQRTGNPCRLWALYENMTEGKTSWTWTPYDDMTALPKPFGATGCCGAGEGYDFYNDFLYHVQNTFPKIKYGFVWPGKADLKGGENIGQFLSHPWVLSRDDLKPEQAICSFPRNQKAAVSVNPTLRSSAYLGPRAHHYSQWQVAVGHGTFETPIYDSGKRSDALIELNLSSISLEYKMQYKWRVRHGYELFNGGIVWGEWSKPYYFTTISKL